MAYHLTETELAERWKVSIKKLQADRGFQRGPAFFKAGRNVRYPLAAVEAYEQANTFLSTTDATAKRANLLGKDKRPNNARHLAEPGAM